MSGAPKGAGKAGKLANFLLLFVFSFKNVLGERVLQTVAVEACDRSCCTISVQTRHQECNSTLLEEKQCVVVLRPSVPHSRWKQLQHFAR